MGESPILHENLTEEMLQRIAKIYATMKGMIPTSLEQFEVTFMRDTNPLYDIEMWEIIARCFEKAIKHFGDDPETKLLIYQNIHMMLLGAIANDSGTKTLRKLFSEAHHELTKS